MGALRGPRRIKETPFHKLSSLFKLPMRRLADSRTEAELGRQLKEFGSFAMLFAIWSASKEQSSGGFSIALIDVSVWTNLRGRTIYRQTILAVPLRILRPLRW